MKNYNKKYFADRDLLIPHLARTIKNIAEKHRLKTVLDVGCGTGRLVQYLRQNGFDAEGCDIATDAVKAARKINPQSKITKASATKLPFGDNSLDLLCSISTVEHLKAGQTDIFLKEALRILKPQGYIFLTTPNFATPIRLIQGKKWFGYSDPTHINFFTPADLQNLLRKHNFRNFAYTFPVEYHASLDWGLPAPLGKLPSFIKQFLIYLLFTTPLAKVRNSFWILAQKE